MQYGFEGMVQRYRVVAVRNGKLCSIPRGTRPLPIPQGKIMTTRKQPVFIIDTPNMLHTGNNRREPGIAAPLYNGVQRDSEGLGITGVEPLGRVSLDGVLLEPVTVRGRPLATGDRVRGPTVSTPPLRKLLFSATLTSSPQKLSELGVLNPIVYTAREVIAPSGTSAADRSKLLQRQGRDDSQEDCLDKGSGEKRLLAQETKRSTLDEAGVDDYDGNGIEGKEGLFSTPAMLEETYMVCEAQVRFFIQGDDSLF